MLLYFWSVDFPHHYRSIDHREEKFTIGGVVISTMIKRISTLVTTWFCACLYGCWLTAGYVMYDYSSANVAFVANPGNAATKNLAVNSNGSSIIVIFDGINKAYLSHNYGTNWTSLGAAITTASHLVVGSISSTGQYMYLAGYASNSSARVHLSSDYGATWTLSSYAPTVSSYPYSISTDDTGQYVVLSTEEKRILLSSDYGATFTSIYTGANAVGDVVVTTNGYIYFCDTANIYRGTITSLSFTATKGLNNLCQSLTVSSDGAYVYSSDGWSLLSSSNFGDTWSTLSGVTYNGIYYPFVTIASSSSDGSVVAMMSTYYPVVSTNFGGSWRVIDPNEVYYFDAIRVTGSGSRVYMITQSQATQDGLYVIAGTSSIVASPTASPTTSSATDSHDQSDRASPQLIAAAVIGSVGGLLVAWFIAYVIYWKFFVPYSSVTSDTEGISLQP